MGGRNESYFFNWFHFYFSYDNGKLHFRLIILRNRSEVDPVILIPILDYKFGIA
jgi:hypothetical protein